jgi:hypothetical protein
MLPTNERGEYITIRNVFHSLNTRLDEINDGISDLVSIETEISVAEITFAIEKYNNGFSPSELLIEINYSMGLILKIQEAIDIFDGSSLTTSWFSYQDILDELKYELNYYKLCLEKVSNKLVLHLKSKEEEEEVKSAINKIPINITVPQFSRLLSLFCNEDKRTDISKIFDSELSKLCTAMITIFKQPNGEDISYNSLSDKKNNDKYKIRVLEFWRERFKAYHILCANLIIEEVEKENKKKKV